MAQVAHLLLEPACSARSRPGPTGWLAAGERCRRRSSPECQRSGGSRAPLTGDGTDQDSPDGGLDEGRDMKIGSGGQKIDAGHLTKRYGSTLAVDDLSFTVILALSPVSSAPTVRARPPPCG